MPRYEDLPSQRRVDPDYNPEATREMLHHMADRPPKNVFLPDAPSNQNSIGIEMAAAKRVDPSPTELWFRQVDNDLDALDSALNRLFQKLQPALSPGYHGNDEGESADKDLEQSSLVEQLKMISRRINGHIESVTIVARRVEL